MDAARLKTAIEFNAALRDTLGLDILTKAGGTLKRPTWESVRASGFSPFQEAAFQLKLGRPGAQCPLTMNSFCNAEFVGQAFQPDSCGTRDG